MNNKFTGTGVAVVTPFKDQQIDFYGLTRIINHVIDGGVDYIVSLGSTGEAITCTREECRAVLDHAITTIDGRVPLVAGPFGYNDTKTLASKIKSYNFNGIDAILSSSPAYNKPSQEGIYQHFMHVADASPVPVILYNVPGRTSSNMSSETTLRLAEASSNIIGIKEASANLSQCMEISKNKPERFLLISGDDVLTLPMLSFGASGVISVIANAFPMIFSNMVRFALNGNFDNALEEHFKLLDFHPHLYVEGNPPGIKGLMELLGLCSREVRLPLTPLSDTVLSQLSKCLASNEISTTNPV